MSRSLNIAVACGGTGGHTFPGVATAQTLATRGHAVTLWTGGRHAETAAVGAWDGPVRHVRAIGFGGGGRRTVYAGTLLTRAVFAAWRFLRADRPDVLLAMGSYASVGPVLAARLLRIPVVLHEANAIPGKAIKFLARYAAAIGVGFPAAATALRGCRVTVTGFPLRPELAAGPPAARPPGPFTLLVMGGSQGARALNETVPLALGALRQRVTTPLRAIHLAGRDETEAVARRYSSLRVEAEVHAFLPEIWRAYAAADFAVARAGAATCAELAVAGVPALLIPYPHAADDHQTANAMLLLHAGGVDVRQQVDLSCAWLVDYLAERLTATDRLVAMRRALAEVAVPDGDVRLARLVEQAGGLEHADL
jgi:UDP-N-acetylglucosamine--N-acetylmuramyl-(pentapeptide) pyrophosphoryl-undecaprenol N-acetylglucosamine transferase